MSIIVRRSVVDNIPQILTFEEWLLSESVKPKETLYGNNVGFDNNKISKIGPFYETFFLDTFLYHVAIENNIVGFGVSVDIPTTEEELDNLTFSDQRIVTKSALNVFNKVFFVILKLLEEAKLKEVNFVAANSDLKKIYDALLANRYFNEELNKIGYSNLIYEDNKYKSKFKG